MKIRTLLIVVILCLLYSHGSAQIQANPPEDDTTRTTGISDHRAGSGFLLVNEKKATLSLSPYVTIRYLNQSGFDDTYTDSFGRTSTLDKRNDLQLQKVTLYFKGWLASPKFRYFIYVWTSNANQGLGAQVVLGGNLQYQFNKHLDIGAGIGPLPTTRSLYGQWPFWVRQDARPMADEYFRGSFTSGVWVQGEIAKNIYYKSMLGNNLSQLGVDAGQMDDSFDTWSTALWWTTGDYGRPGPYGDLEKHETIATMLAGSFTRSTETRQSQPGADAPENSQIRLSDGTGLFNINAFNNGSQVLEATYKMADINGGIKYKGLSLDLEFYMRWISNLKYTGELPVSKLFDKGVTVQATGMVIPKKLMAYTTASYIDGEYGNPRELTVGLNWYVLGNRIIRINPEVMFVDRSPVGYLSYPTLVGASGSGFMINVELFW